MELYIFNKNLELKGILEVYTSLRWIRSFYKAGKFELHCKLNSKTKELLTKDNLIYKKDDTELGCIESIKLHHSSNEDETIQVTGTFITGYLKRRINWGRLTFNGSCEMLMRKLVNDNAINPTNVNRKIPNLILGDLKSFNDEIHYQNSFGNILDELEKISNTYNVGYKIDFDYIERKLIFNTYKGIDRSLNQTIIAPCIFSRDFENILEQDYFESINNFKNTCLIAGAGEGLDRKLTSIENGYGLDRYELFVDARDIADKDRKTNDEGEEIEIEIPPSKYIPLLVQRGEEKLKECKEINTFDSKVNTRGNNIYKKDYDLGDIVTVFDKKWNIQLDARITEIEEVYENGNLEINPIFGNEIPTIIDKIKRIVR